MFYRQSAIQVSYAVIRQLILFLLTGNRVFLGFAGVLAACLAIVASFGFVSLCGMKFVSIVGNLPFLVLGK